MQKNRRVHLIYKYRMKNLTFPLLVNTGVAAMGMPEERALKNASRDPRFSAERTLRDILTLSKDTVYGKQHHFSEILACQTSGELFKMYQRMVPANDFEALRPYVERHKNGEKDILFPGKPSMYATTSGTTSEPKWVPMTKKYLKDVYGKMSHMWVWNFIKHRPYCFAGHILQIVGKECEGYAPDGTLYGSVSGVLVRDIPQILKKRYTSPPEVMAISDYAARNYVIMLLALQWEDLTFWATANPSTMLELIHTVDNRYDELVHDIETGVISAEVGVDADLLPIIAPYLHANPKRAAQLRELKKQHEKPQPKHYWPYLQLLSTWKCGNTKIYMEKYWDSFDWDQTFYQELGYIATECRFGFSLDETNESVLFPHFHYYEFVEEDELDSPHKHYLQIDELEMGHRYCAYVTTYSGLFRYNMNDLIEVGGKYGNTPTIHMVSKVNGIVSLTGEKLYEPQFIQAVHEAEAETEILTSFFVGFADIDNSRYDFYFEFRNEEVDQATADRFAKVVDEHLQKINLEYESKRQSFRLGEPVAHILLRNAYSRFKKKCLDLGYRDGQFKFNLLMQDQKREAMFKDLLILGRQRLRERQKAREERFEARAERREERREARAERRAERRAAWEERRQKKVYLSDKMKEKRERRQEEEAKHEADSNK